MYCKIWCNKNEPKIFCVCIYNIIYNFVHLNYLKYKFLTSAHWIVTVTPGVILVRPGLKGGGIDVKLRGRDTKTLELALKTSRRLRGMTTTTTTTTGLIT